MNRREVSKTETRRLIMAAARKLFLEKDVDQCTMRAIAKLAGVSAASVVVHFKNKGALMEAALTEDIERTTAQALATLPAEGNLAQRLTHIWRAMYTFYDANRKLYRVLIRSTVFEPEEDTPFLTWQTITFFNFLEKMIDDERAEGRMAPSVESYLLAAALFSQYFGVLIMFYRDPSMTPGMAADLVLAMTRQTLDGLVRIPAE
jgi:AcrR family transcriptional regulator